MRKSGWSVPAASVGRWSWAAFLLAFLGSTFAAGAHWVTIPHRLCEVHGTVEHGPAAAEPEGPSSPLPEPAGPLVRDPVAQHDECALGPTARTEAVLALAPEQRGLFVAEARGSAPVRAAPAPSVPLLLRAPSRSPPA